MWFKNAYDRASAANYVMTVGQIEEVYPGLRRTSLYVPLGGVAILTHQTHRMIFNPLHGYAEPVATPYYRMHFSYQSQAGEKVTSLIDFDDNFAYLKRSSEYTNPRPTRPNETAIWDEGMAALDESIYTHAKDLGWSAVVPLVGEFPEYQRAYETAA